MTDNKLNSTFLRIVPPRVIIMFILFTTGIICAGLSFYQSQRKRIYTEQENSLKAIATLKIGQIVNWKKERLGDAAVIRDNIPVAQSIKQYFNKSDNNILSMWLKKWIASVYNDYDYCGVLLLDPSLKVRMTAVPFDTVAGESIHKELIDVLNTRSIVITDFHKSESVKYVHLDILIPLFDPENESKIAGIAILRIDPSKYLFPLIQSWPTSSRSAETLLLRQEGDSVVYLNELRHQKNKALQLTLPVAKVNLLASLAVKGLNGMHEGVDYRNIPVVGYVSNIPDTPWYMVAKIDKAELQKPLTRYFLITFILVLTLILLNSLFFGYWIWEQRIIAVKKQLDNERLASESKEKLIKTEDLYKRLFDNMLNGFAYCRMLYEKDVPYDFIYLSVNKAFELQTGLRNVVGHKVSEAIPGILESDPELIQTYGRVSLTGKPEYIETYVESLKMWFSLSVYSPEKEYFVAVFDVITERKLIEKHLQETNQYLSNLFNYANAPIIVWDNTLAITQFNHAFERLTGYFEEEVLGKRIDILFPEDNAEYSLDLINRAITGERWETVEIDIKRKNGDSRTILWNSANIMDKDNKSAIATIAQGNDITDRKQVEKALLESEERFRSLYENITIGMYRTTVDGQILLANPAMLKMMGFDSLEQLAQRNLEKEGYEPEYPRSDFHGTMEKLGRVTGIESAWKKRDGTVLFIRESASAVRDKNDNILYYDGTVEDITDRKKIEKDLEEERNLLRTLMDLLPSLIFVKDRESRFIMANSVCAEFMGVTSPQDLIGQTDFDFYKPDIAGDFRSDEQSVLNGVPVINKEEGSYSPSGNPRNLLTTKVPLRDVKGNIIGLVGTCFDITDLKKAEAALIESEDKFKYVFEHSSVGKSITLITGEINVNTAFCKMLGYQPEELNETKWTEISHPDDIEQTNKELNKLLTGEKESVRFIKRYFHKNGLIVWGDLSTSLRRDLNNAPLYFMSTVIDITEKKKAEDALRLKNFVFDASIAANSIADLDGKITETNSAFVNLWGYPDKATLIGKPISIFLKYPEEADKIVVALQKEGNWEGDYTAIKMDGSVFIAHGLATSIVDETGKIIGFQSAVIDITDRKKQEDEIQKLNEDLEERVLQRTSELASANRELEAFSYSVSHDLRSPLRAIHSFTAILNEDYGTLLDEEGKRICGIIETSTVHMGNLIDDLLAFSRAGRTELSSTKIDMTSLVKSVFAELVSHEEQKRIEFKIEDLPHASGDLTTLRLVWTNLISNAIKYSSKKEKPVLKVGFENNDDQVIYYIKDNGAGFDMKYYSKLFGVFQRLHSQKEFDGNGVGLAIVQRIIKRHNGNVWAKSELNKGATFYFSLPVLENIHKL